MEKTNKQMCTIPDEILETLQKDIAEIKVALLGNAYNPSGGLLCRVTEVEKMVAQLKGKYEKAVWTTSTIAVFIAVIANLIMWVFDVWSTVSR